MLGGVGAAVSNGRGYPISLMFDSCVCVEPDGYTEYCSEKIVAARCPRQCCECGCEIAKGERYERANGKTEGEWWQAATCLTCRAIRSSLFKCGYVFGEMWNEIHDLYCGDCEEGECICPDPSE